jgi:CENP-B N-terminal DNA-binding domain
MRLPEVATRLRELAIELNCDELDGLADEIGRRPSGQRAPATSAPMTDSLREKIHALKEAEPNLSQAEIGKRLNINPGRVSETLKGKRE